MAVRTASDAVKLIIETDASISTDLVPFIETASYLIDKLLVTAVDEEGNLYHDSTSLELVERWLAAHFYAIRDLRRASEKAGSVGESVMYKVDLNLALTVYGQQAMLLDISGELAAHNNNVTEGSTKTASMVWLGEDPNETLGEH